MRIVRRPSGWRQPFHPANGAVATTGREPACPHGTISLTGRLVCSRDTGGVRFAKGSTVKSARALKLKKETLTELLADDLSRVVAGVSGPSCNPALCPTACTSCASDFQQCFTGHGCIPTLDGCIATADTTC